jgi:hypothetical protein
MNPSLPLNGNPPHARQMPVPSRRGFVPAVAINVRSSGREAWTARMRKRRRFAESLFATLLALVFVALGVVVGLTFAYGSRF